MHSRIPLYACQLLHPTLMLVGCTRSDSGFPNTQTACGCDKSMNRICCNCWNSGGEIPGFFCVNIGSSTLSCPKEKIALDTFTTSSISNLLVLPTSVQAATQLVPGMVHNQIAEVAMV
jgi:hypothetical protein